MTTVPSTVQPPFDALYAAANDIRRAIKQTAALQLHLVSGLKAQQADPEAIANAMLSYRHLEDASMRLGKVLQHIDGGVSVYDKTTTVGAPELADIIAGAIYSFAGHLTALTDPLEVGASKNAAPIAELVSRWLEEQGVNQDHALVQEWRNHLPKAPTPANDLAPIGG